jgi:hypothetical protein
MKIMRKVIFLFSLLALFFCFIAASIAYETIPFKNGGSIEGIVEYAGATAQVDPVLALSSETEYCGQSMPAKKYLIKNGKIQNVIVYIVDIKSGKAISDESVTITSLKCEFVPHVAVGFMGKKIIMRTDDPVFHTFDIHASIGGKEVYHAALPEKGSSVTKNFAKAGLMELSCYVHPWQHAYVYIFIHPYAVITDEKGKFIIKDIPPGTYTVEAWHEALGTKKMANVKIESGKTSMIKLKYTSERE